MAWSLACAPSGLEGPKYQSALLPGGARSSHVGWRRSAISESSPLVRRASGACAKMRARFARTNPLCSPEGRGRRTSNGAAGRSTSPVRTSVERRERGLRFGQALLIPVHFAPRRREVVAPRMAISEPVRSSVERRERALRCGHALLVPVRFAHRRHEVVARRMAPLGDQRVVVAAAECTAPLCVTEATFGGASLICGTARVKNQKRRKVVCDLIKRRTVGKMYAEVQWYLVML